MGGSRDQTKNDIRALPEILTVTLVEPEKGGVQRDIGSKYLSTLKLHARKPKDSNKDILMKKLVLLINTLRGVSVLRYKERKPKQRRKAFHGSYKITEGDYQKLMKKLGPRYAQMKKRLIGSGPNRDTGGGKGWTRPSMKRGKNPPVGFGAMEELEEPRVEETQAHPDRFDTLYEDILITLGTEGDELRAFTIQNSLNEKLWGPQKKMHPGVKAAILDIVEEFMESLELEEEPTDIIITGSIANYNWSKFSDIDVHIILDFEKVNHNTTMVKKFFDAVRSNWNKLHNIFVKGHEVEIYLQDAHEPHVSTGVYSLIDDEWRTEAVKENPVLDKQTATKKMKQIVREVDKLSSLYDRGYHADAFYTADKLRAKIKRMRRTGLDRGGIYSPENLAFKMLRRSGDIEQLFAVYTAAYDKLHSVDQ